MVVQCCVCKRVHIEDGWETVADADLAGAAASHGYCPTCLDNAYAEFNALQRTAAAAAA
ncbi:MAG: hypothetical protein RBU21_09685 [FCB group bacterium]|nr:hypothetical protein [FCB group bacterium]